MVNVVLVDEAFGNSQVLISDDLLVEGSPYFLELGVTFFRQTDAF